MERLSWVLLFLYLAAFPFGQLSRFNLGFGGREVGISVSDLLVVLIGVVWFVRFLRGKLEFPPISKEVLLFLSAFFFSFLFAVQRYPFQETIVAGMYLIRIVSYGLFYFAIWEMVKSRSAQDLLFKSLLAIGLAVVVLGWAQYFFFTDIRPFAIWGWDEHYLRLVGAFLDPGFTSIILVFLVILLVSKFMPVGIVKSGGANLFHIRGGMAFHLSFLLILFIVFVGLLFTYSRAGYVSFIVGMATISFIKRKPLIIISSIFILIAGILLLPKNSSEGTTLIRTTSTFARFESWSNAIELWKTSPVFGVGFNFYPFAQDSYRRCHPEFISGSPEILKQVQNDRDCSHIPNHGMFASDSSVLFVLATTGVIGLLLFGHFGLRVLTSVWGRYGIAQTAFVSSFAALTIHSIFLNSLFYPHVMGWMAILYALAIRGITGRR